MQWIRMDGTMWAGQITSVSANYQKSQSLAIHFKLTNYIVYNFELYKMMKFILICHQYSQSYIVCKLLISDRRFLFLHIRYHTLLCLIICAEVEGLFADC